MSDLKHRLKEIADYSLMYGEGDDVRLAIDAIDALQARVKELDNANINMGKQIIDLTLQRDELLSVLHRLACLGNGDRYGNSDGNTIAQEAIAKIEAERSAVTAERKA